MRAPISFVSLPRTLGSLALLLALAGPVWSQAGGTETGAAAASAAAVNGAAPALFRHHVAAFAADSTFTRDRQAVRWRAVNLDLNLLTAAADAAPGTSAIGQSIALNLFDDVSFIADAERIERTARGVNWIGRLRGVEMSQVVLVINGAVVAGNITMPEGRFHIRFSGNGAHEVQQIDQSLFPDYEPSMPATDIGVQQDFSYQSDPTVQADDGSIIDVMVVYTATARAAAGGTAALQSLVDLAIAETNQSYQNSGVTQRLRLVHAEEVVYTEAGASAALSCITSTADDCLDHVHALRNTYGADLVSFWLEDGGGTTCGIAWVMETVSPSFASSGFSVVDRGCATGYYSFGHELGHNMGAKHDLAVDNSITPYPYAHGYTNPPAHWRTIMAYNNACAASGGCTRIQYWANPGVTYGGAAMGDAATADDHRALNNTAYTVANFRASVSPPACSYDLSAASHSAGAAATADNVNVTVAAGCTWTAVSNAAWIIVTSGSSDSGNGSVGYSVAANAGTGPRSGTITIAGQTFTVNQTFEDGFPSGATLPAGWIQPAGSSASWAVTSAAYYGGANSIRSGAIANNQNSALQASGKFKAGTISFSLKVDSESNYDYLNFYIDGALIQSWSGAVDWTLASYPVAKGAHSFKWEYRKDEIVVSGADAAWIDNVVLPENNKATDLGTILMLLLD